MIDPQHAGGPARVLPASGDPAVDHATRQAVEAAASVLRDAGTVVLPTDTVYGLAALPAHGDALARIFSLKQRPDRQPLAVLVADPAQASRIVDGPSEPVRAVMEELWPGALTLVLPRRAECRHLELGGNPSTVGVRCPGSAVARAIAAAVGPIATTSANRHGEPTPHVASEAGDGLHGLVDLVLDGGPCRARPSTVIDATGERWRVLRDGTVPIEAIVAAGGPHPRATTRP